MMSQDTTTTTITDFNFNLLFDSSSSVKLDNNNKNEEFDFTAVWNGLTAVNNTAMIVDNKQQEQQNSSLSSFIPTTSAVVGSDESPMMDTPFLDNSCMNTPFTPAVLFTPSNHTQNSPYYSPYIESSSTNMNTISLADFSGIKDDIQVANYLKNDFSWEDSDNHLTATGADLFSQLAPATDENADLMNSFTTFNGDPNQLLLNKNDNNDDTGPSLEDSSDFLFPPLPSDSQQATTSCTLVESQQQTDLFSSQEFDASTLFDDCFDDIFFGMPETSTTQPNENLQQKRKLSADNKSVNNAKRAKLLPVSTKDDAVIKKKKKNIDQNERRFECQVCHAMFNRRYNLGTHIKTHDKNRSKEFACYICQKSFDRKHDMTRHIATVHNGERAYSCSKCTSSFSRKDALVRHHIQKHNYES